MFDLGKRRRNQPTSGPLAQFSCVRVPHSPAVVCPLPQDLPAWHLLPSRYFSFFFLWARNSRGNLTIFKNIEAVSVSVCAICRPRAEQDRNTVPQGPTTSGKMMEGSDGGSTPGAGWGSPASCCACLPTAPGGDVLPIPALPQCLGCRGCSSCAQALPGAQGVFCTPVRGAGSGSHWEGRNTALPIPCRGVCLNPDAGLIKWVQLPRKIPRACWWRWCGETLKTLLPQNLSQSFCCLHLGKQHEEDSSTVILFPCTHRVNKKIKAQINIHQKVILVCHGNNLHL